MKVKNIFFIIWQMGPNDDDSDSGPSGSDGPGDW